MLGSEQGCLAAIGLDPVDLDSDPDPWTYFLAWLWTCLITVDLSGDLDSCVSLLTVTGLPALPCSGAVGQDPCQRGHCHRWPCDQDGLLATLL